MSQPSALPGLLSPEAVQLIDGQYADRLHLRPILDAVLAALPALGPVTVEARRTLVSLVTPRRIFAVVRATTKQRVDLGLRLDGPDGLEHGGRLQPARNLGAATVRIALTEPGEFDDEAVSLAPAGLRAEHGAASATAQARTPAQARAHASDRRDRGPRPARPLLLRRAGHTDLPERSPGLRSTSKDRPTLVTPGYPWQVTEPVPGDARSARWEIEVTVRRGDDGLDFGGPFVRGDRTDRHLGLVWGDVLADGTFRLIRGSKLKLADVDPALIAEAMRPGSRLVARIRYADEEGHFIRPADLAWSVVHT
jgi:Family of unknown function (DUF5990)